MPYQTINNGDALTCYAKASPAVAAIEMPCLTGSCMYSKSKVDFGGFNGFMSSCCIVTKSDGVCATDAIMGFEVCYCNTDLCNKEGGPTGSPSAASNMAAITWLLVTSAVVGKLFL